MNRWLTFNFTLNFGRVSLLRSLKKNLGDKTREFEGFQDWLAQRYQIKSTHGWERIILFYAADEREAFGNFFKLLEQWRQGEKAVRSAEEESSPVTLTDREVNFC